MPENRNGEEQVESDVRLEEEKRVFVWMLNTVAEHYDLDKLTLNECKAALRILGGTTC